jgi:hypothetical protein
MESFLSPRRMHSDLEPSVIEGARKRGDAPHSKRWREIRASLEKAYLRADGTTSTKASTKARRERFRQRFMESLLSPRRMHCDLEPRQIEDEHENEDEDEIKTV